MIQTGLPFGEVCPRPRHLGAPRRLLNVDAALEGKSETPSSFSGALGTTAFVWSVEAFMRQLLLDIVLDREVCAQADHIALLVRDPARLARDTPPPSPSNRRSARVSHFWRLLDGALRVEACSALLAAASPDWLDMAGIAKHLGIGLGPSADFRRMRRDSLAKAQERANQIADAGVAPSWPIRLASPRRPLTLGASALGTAPSAQASPPVASGPPVDGPPLGRRAPPSLWRRRTPAAPRPLASRRPVPSGRRSLLWQAWGRDVARVISVRIPWHFHVAAPDEDAATDLVRIALDSLRCAPPLAGTA